MSSLYPQILAWHIFIEISDAFSSPYNKLANNMFYRKAFGKYYCYNK